MRELWGKIKDGLRNAMLSPGFKDYDPEYPAGEYDEYDDEPLVSRVAPKAKTWEDHARAATAPKAHKPGKFDDKIVELYGRKGQSEKALKIIVAEPQDLNASRYVADCIKDGKTCLVNLNGLEPGAAQRIADFIGGTVYALNGMIMKTSKGCFAAVPENVEITGDMKEELTHGGHLFPWVSAASR
jgi:cell division inhibitor SepF